MRKQILYFREIASGLDSGMTIQILNDYGHLSKLDNDVHVPVFLKDAAKQEDLKEYVGSQAVQKLKPLFLRSGLKKARVLACIGSFIATLVRRRSSGCVIVLRERKFLLPARLLRFFFRTPIVSELHEGGIPLEESKSLRRRFQLLFDKVDGLVFTNFSQVDYLLQRGYTLPKNVIVLPNGVDTARFSQTTAAEAGAPEVVMAYAGQFTSWKNLPLLFESLQQLPDNFRLRIAGGKENAEVSRAYVDELQRQYGVEGRVDFLGFVHPDRVVPDVLSGSSLLVLPLGGGSIAQYATSPMKLVEYMATPIPIVAVSAPSVLGLTGTDTVYLSEMNAQSFAEAVKNALNDSSAAKEERIRRSNVIARRYDHKERAARYDQWLNDIVLQNP